MFYAVYYISMISEIKKIECELNESGIFGGRGMGILINMFSLQYIFELYKKPLVCIVLIVVSVIVLILSRKYIKSFWTKNIWSKQFLLIFIAVVLPVDLIDKAAQQDDGPDEMQPEHQNNKRGQ